MSDAIKILKSVGNPSPETIPQQCKVFHDALIQKSGLKILRFVLRDGMLFIKVELSQRKRIYSKVYHGREDKLEFTAGTEFRFHLRRWSVNPETANQIYQLLLDKIESDFHDYAN